MSRFKIAATPLEGVHVVERSRVGDARGFLSRLFCADELRAAGWHTPVAQINHTWTRRGGTIRGMHFQRAPHAEIKLVSCIRGAVFDVAVDLRRHSPTYLRWHAEELSADGGRALLIPEGVAHGFQSLTDDCELLYLHSAPYAPAADAGVNPLDPRLAIAWPLPVAEISARDAGHPLLNDIEDLGT